ncbi:MAG: alkaline phosphatase family protein [Anaerolineae bacterium]|nr:alkaline phosphatase family protein [Anaerolineae bacterium]
MPGHNALIIIQLDGLSLPRLRDGIARGLLPSLGRWLQEGTHHLHPLDSGLPSQTSSAQATLLYGVSDPPPGFRWYDRRASRARTSRNPADLRRVATAWPANDGLLRGGAALSTAWPAGADHRTLVLSEGPRWANLRAIPWAAALGARWPQGSRGASPAALLRGTLVAGVLDPLTTAAAVAAIGETPRPIFATLLGYDQVAHHAGLDAPMTAWALRRLDDSVRAIEDANLKQGGRSEIVVFADHGLSGCASFQRLRRESLGGMIARLTRTGPRVWHVAPSGNLAHVYALNGAAQSALEPLVQTLIRDDAIGFVVHNRIVHGRLGKRGSCFWGNSWRHSARSLWFDRTADATNRRPGPPPGCRGSHCDGRRRREGRCYAFEDQRAAHGGLVAPKPNACCQLPGLPAAENLPDGTSADPAGNLGAPALKHPKR